MKSSLNFDDFYVVIGKHYNGDDDRRFSLLGLQFFSDLVTQAVEKAGLNPSQVVIKVGENKYVYDAISIAWPTPSTALVTGLSIRNDPVGGSILVGERRGYKHGKMNRKTGKWETSGLKREDFQIKIQMADPNILDLLAEAIKLSLPKNSKYVEKT